ncbi:MAG: PhnD/SsuA/transferrin family substrate-binding protein [Bdellovibrionota bacterium]
MSKPIIVGAVLYDPKVSVIWDIIGNFFEQNGCPIDTVFYTNYELQVTGLLDGHLDIAWNSPLAWLDAQHRSRSTCRAIAMRDTDRDRKSFLVAKRSGGLKTLADLRGKIVALGAKDSPQATLIPLGLLGRAGLVSDRDFTVRRFDVLVGKHGDHIGGELEAFRCVKSGNADVCAMLDLNWLAWTKDGTIDTEQFEVIAETDLFDHCVFAVRSSFDSAREAEWLKVLYSMSYENPAHREMMDLEGLKAWLPGRTSGFAALADAVERLDYFSVQP